MFSIINGPLNRCLESFFIFDFLAPFMIKLSVVIITLNEEKNIARCLESVQQLADEIVVVDSFSTDRTEEIVKSFNGRFITHAFDGYVNQKNFANTQANFDFILSLDADEALSEELMQSIKNVKLGWNADGYMVNRLTNYAGHWVKHCGWYPDRKLRLYDRRKGEWTGLIIHEEFRLFDKQQPGYLKGDLLHYSFHSVEDHKKQSEKFTTLGARADFQKGKKAPWYKLWFAAPFKFFQSYFIQLGILDGQTGFTICRLSAVATYQKYKKLKALYNEKA